MGAEDWAATRAILSASIKDNKAVSVGWPLLKLN